MGERRWMIKGDESVQTEEESKSEATVWFSPDFSTADYVDSIGYQTTVCCFSFSIQCIQGGCEDLDGFLTRCMTVSFF